MKAEQSPAGGQAAQPHDEPPENSHWELPGGCSPWESRIPAFPPGEMKLFCFCPCGSTRGRDGMEGLWPNPGWLLHCPSQPCPTNFPGNSSPPSPHRQHSLQLHLAEPQALLLSCLFGLYLVINSSLFNINVILIFPLGGNDGSGLITELRLLSRSPKPILTPHPPYRDGTEQLLIFFGASN